MKVSAIIAAAGRGRRMGGKQNKQFLRLGNDMILNLTLQQLDQIEEIKELIVVVGASEVKFCLEEIFAKGNFQTPYRVIAGGKERQDSVRAGLAVLSHTTDYVLIHDGARPLITKELIKNALKTAKEKGTAVLAVPVKDTIKVVDQEGYVKSTPERATLRAVQTPQIFRKDLICAAYEKAEQTGFYGTDDASLVEAMGVPVFLVEGSYENIKITTPEDLLLAEEILRRRSKCG
ncbi:2-C-methyl-D-erythritol 4-phosphate cytidylyltransferase [Anoxybacter fermentans]|uniref:2-C-methyl-D-erythritol 4-phosphate cytidylyltransferase n=1 Tax=Anoxybacter fermentans TaxID=1323375 RepID=A0A3S9T2E3_9FIRM|nr:2-C-methyl-D-erythritol 4-phosphate cytidylyltransferase [Anoxybacter fermentans]AZR74691.1 2-C-methyl-D-erythritol 4-phosphate cytidylyltransferase [Anoxybacter fermentans]